MLPRCALGFLHLPGWKVPHRQQVNTGQAQRQGHIPLSVARSLSRVAGNWMREQEARELCTLRRDLSFGS